MSPLFDETAMKHFSMTGAELRTLREGLGLSPDDLGALADVQGRTIKHWESGRAGVPDDVAALVLEWDARFTNAAREALAVPKPGGWGPDDELVLLRYLNTEDLHFYRPDMRALPHTAHGALLSRVRLALSALGVSVRVVYLQPEAYNAWRKATGNPADTEATRAAWASLQVEAQCLPRPASH